MATNTKTVTPSGTVGKIIIAQSASVKAVLAGYSLVASGSVARIVFRHGKQGASGEVVWEDRVGASAVSGAGGPFMFPEDARLEFTRGMHVTVIGTGAVAYLLLA